MSGPQEATAMDCRGQGLQGLAARGPGPGGVRSVTNQMLAVMVMCCKAGRKLDVKDQPRMRCQRTHQEGRGKSVSCSDCTRHPVQGCEEIDRPKLAVTGMSAAAKQAEACCQFPHGCAARRSSRQECLSSSKVVWVQALLEIKGKAARPEELDPVTGYCVICAGLH